VRCSFLWEPNYGIRLLYPTQGFLSTFDRRWNDSGEEDDCGSEFEAVAEFGVDLAGVVVVEAAEGDAVVEQDAIVADVDGVQPGEVDDTGYFALAVAGPRVKDVGYFAAGLEAAPWTRRSFSMLKAPGAELACMPAMALSVSLLTTP
jgi:hypothetical protein